ncbi:MAG: Gfo/Idh/MocA family oxidoreductase [bacterium]|nr:Gfo/Idh/MocA family oxidoreductase [bacterium]
MKAIFFGLGSIGTRHGRILKDFFPPHELFALRSKKEGKENELGIKEVYGWDEVEKLKPEIAFVTNPTNMHIETALKCAKFGMHLFIEKPLSCSMDGVKSLVQLCRKKNLTCYTAYCMRFHPVIKELKARMKGKKIFHVRAVVSSYLPSWRPGTDHKESYSANATQGGGVLLDLSHEFDYLQYLFGAIGEIKGWHGRISNVTVDAEDAADVIIKTVEGVPINLHMNFMSRFEERKVIVDFEGGYAIGDIRNNCVEWMENDKKEEKTFTTTRDDYFKDQLEYFFANIGNTRIMNNLEESAELLKKILIFKERR